MGQKFLISLLMAKSNRKTIHFAHAISDIFAVQRKQMWPRYEAKSVNAMHSETGMKAHNNIKVTLTRLWSFQLNVWDTL